MLLVLLLATAHALSPWQGEYSFTQDTDEEGTWAARLSVSACSDKSCKYSYSAGSAQSDCSAEGTFKIQSASKAIDSQEIKSEEEKPSGKCVLTFEKKKPGSVFVDADGDACNSLCGFQGARYFALDLKRVSEKRYFNPSFSCYAKLTKLETAICTDEKLAGLDRALSDQVAKLKSDHPKSIAKLTTEQRAWLKTRNQKCEKETDAAACLTAVYETRAGELTKFAASAR